MRSILKPISLLVRRDRPITRFTCPGLKPALVRNRPMFTKVNFAFYALMGMHPTFPLLRLSTVLLRKLSSYVSPPHTTHILQSLDIGIFAPLSNAYKNMFRG